MMSTYLILKPNKLKRGDVTKRYELLVGKRGCVVC